MNKPILVVMAAGIGSRYGGLKQMDPIGNNGEWIIDYSVYDAIAAGFEKVIFIINRNIEKEFKSIVGEKLSAYIEVDYAYQEITDLPKEIDIPIGRVKPWGTAHAIYATRDLIDAPFAVINADDFYGKDAFVKIYDSLNNISPDELQLSMVGYSLKNTVTDYGYVSRGVCTVDSNNRLLSVTERTHIEKRDFGIAWLDDDKNWNELDKDSIVSMNLWGLTPKVLQVIEEDIVRFLNNAIDSNPLKCEYFLPYVVNKLIKENRASVDVLTTNEFWYGVTYKEDKEKVVQAIQSKVDNGVYPQNIWEVTKNEL